MRRLLMLSNEFPPLGGGMATVLHEILRKFAEQPDLHIDVITSTHESRRHQETLSKNITIIRIPVPGRCLHHASNLDLVVYGIRALKEALRSHRTAPYDVAMAWSTVPAGAVAFALKKITSLPYVVRLTGPDIPGFEMRYEKLYPLLLPLLTRIWATSECIIAKCKDELDLLRENFLPKRSIIIPNGSIPLGSPRRLTPSDEPLKLLCVARLVERKGHRFLFEALQHLKSSGTDVRLTLVGDGDSAETFKNEVEILGLADRLTFMGYTPRAEMAELYASHHVFVLPSLNESMSVAALEALGYGLPLILTKGGGSDVIVSEGENGFLTTPGSSHELVTAIKQFTDDRSLVDKFGRMSHLKSLSLGWETPAATLFDLLREVARKSC